MAVVVTALAATVACAPQGSSGSISGEVRFAREVELPEGAVITVRLLDITLADAPSVELGLDVDRERQTASRPASASSTTAT